MATILPVEPAPRQPETFDGDFHQRARVETPRPALALTRLPLLCGRLPLVVVRFLVMLD